MNDVKDVLAEDVQGANEQLVFRVLDVDHKDYQAAMDGFVAICKQADLARAYVELVESGALIIQRDWDPEFGEEWVWPEWAVNAASIACRRHMDGRSERNGASDLRAVVMLDALAAVVPEEADK